MRRISLLVLLASLLAGCVTTGNDDDGLERMERNHRAAVETAA